VFKSNRGFTLIELLVVMSIIALLASIVVVRVQTARGRARDAERVQEIRSIQNALALYSASSAGNFPPTGGPFPYGPAELTGVDVISQALLSASYLPAIPKDPLYTGTCTSSASCGYTYEAASAGSYIIKYYLETDSILGKNGAEGGSSNNPQQATP